jgi:hypothetical protein
MTLVELMTDLPPLESLREYVLVFSAELCQRLVNVQAWYGDPRHVPCPVQIADGRWMHNADILSECLPGGLFFAGFSHLDPAGFTGVEVVPLGSVVPTSPQPPALVPEPPEPE